MTNTTNQMSNFKVYNFFSDDQLEEDFIASMMNRSIEQKFPYQWEWSDLFVKWTNKESVYTEENYLNKADFCNFSESFLRNSNCQIEIRG